MRFINSIVVLVAAATSRCAEIEPVVVNKDGSGFELAMSGRPFLPWGHNYGPKGKLLEDIWQTDWDTVANDFREMKEMGANVVRVHLQFGKFMEAADRPNRSALAQLKKLLELAEDVGIYLDITGLGCYRTSDVPAWYDALAEKDRWKAQASFWSAVAEVGAKSPAIFCYDLMNEPVVPGEVRKAGQWYSGKLLGGYDFVQFITLDKAGRERPEIAREWIKTLSRAIRQKDQLHLITVGLLPSTKKWGHLSGFVPEKVAPELDFVSVHIYPQRGKLDEARTVVQQFSVGKPLVIEETFNLTCSPQELRQFLLDSRGKACGWMGHYGGETFNDFDALKKSSKLTIPQAMERQWIELFQELRPEMLGKDPAKTK
jgi:Cellulase (glycosyl hydrolase family 5)